MSEWIEHKGDCQPVTTGTLVETLDRRGVHDGPFPAGCMEFTDGGELVPLVSGNIVSCWIWGRTPKKFEITHYRICKPDAKEARRAAFQSMLEGVKTKAPEGPKRVPEKKRVRT